MSGIGFGERWFQGVVLQWMNELIREKGLPFDGVEQEVQVSTPFGLRRYPDLVVWRDRKERKIACLIELKTPFVDAYDEELVEDGLKKANELGCWFFATWNVNKLVLWETFRPETRLIDRRLKHWDVADVKRIEDVKKADVERRIKSALFSFLETLKQFYEAKEPKPTVSVIPKLYPDEIMVLRLRSAVDTMYLPISEHVIELKERDSMFFKRVGEWFVRQGWIFSGIDDDFDRLSRQSVYLLINKILFYNVLRDKFKLASIDLSTVKSGRELKQRLQEYFNTGVKLGYGLIFASDFLEDVPIPDSAVSELKKLVAELNKYDFSEIGDIIGPVFERLIPATERHKLGQYFTRSDIVDIIIALTVKNSDDIVLDPACGSGTFLVRSYFRKKYLERKLLAEGKLPKREKSHEELLNELWGIDISKFPATLTEINLIARKLEALENKPRVLCRDFFDVSPGLASLPFEPSKEYSEKGLDVKEYEVIVPSEFDVVITNPPYTRQEEMEDLLQKGYKDRLKVLIEKNLDVTLGKRSSIYAYFFFWGGHFLKNGGRMGLITSNSWLDVDFGRFLQEYFLKNFKIVCVIESKVERWFEDADVNTAITVLEKCADESKRNSNFVRFIQLKRPIEEYISAHGDEYNRQDAVEKFTSIIEDCLSIFKFKKIDCLGTTLQVYDDDKIRIVLVSQADLWKQGYDAEKRKYSGAKWGKYIRAPDIYFKILDKGEKLFVPLNHVASVQRGFTTGSNDFFYLNEEQIQQLGIEKRFWSHIEKGESVPNWVMKSPRESKSIIVDPRELKYRVLMIHEEKKDLIGTKVLEYIQRGETEVFGSGRKANIPAKKPTCAARKIWYDLGEREPGDILWMMSLNDRHIAFLNPHKVYADARLYDVLVKDKNKVHFIAAFMNTSLFALFAELEGRLNLGQGALDIKVYEVARIPILDPSKLSNEQLNKISLAFNEMLKREIGSIFEEIKAKYPSEVKLENVRQDRKKLDETIVVDILGMGEKDLLELYRGLVDLIRSRLERAKSVLRGKKRKGIDIEAITKHILREIDTSFLKNFPEEYIKGAKEFSITKIPRGKPELKSDLISGYYVEIGSKKILCTSKTMAQYIWYGALLGRTELHIPSDTKLLERAVKEFNHKFNELEGKITTTIQSLIQDKKIKERVKNEIWKKLLQQQ